MSWHIPNSRILSSALFGKLACRLRPWRRLTAGSGKRTRRSAAKIPQAAEVLEQRVMLTVLFSDTFAATDFNPENWSVVQNATIDDVGVNEPSAPFAARLNGDSGQGDVLESAVIDLSGRSGLTLTYSFQRTGGGDPPEIGNNLLLEYRNASGEWVVLDRQLGSGPSLREFGQSTVALPSEALHAGFQFRFRTVGFTGPRDLDDWFVDDVALRAGEDVSGEPFSASQTQTDNLFYPNVLTFEFRDVPIPTDTGRLTVTADGDLAGFLRNLELRVDGTLVDHLFIAGGQTGDTSEVTLLLSQPLLETAAADGVISFSVKPSISVRNLGASSITLDLSYTGRPSDVSPPVAESAVLGDDGSTITVQFNDDDLDPAAAVDPSNYRLVAAHGDADGDGDPFNDGDETDLAIESIQYSPETDQVTLHALDRLFADHFALLLDGDDATSDGASGITDLAGNLLEGGDRSFRFDRSVETLAGNLLESTAALSLPEGTGRPLQSSLASAVHLIEKDAGNARAVDAHLDNYARQLQRAVRRGELSESEFGMLMAQVEQLRLGLDSSPTAAGRRPTVEG